MKQGDATRENGMRPATSPDGRDVVAPGKWHGKFPREKATEERLKHEDKKRRS